jgi:hypothetical protein
MDLGDLLILLLFLFPVLSRLFGGKKKPTPQRTRPLPRPDDAARRPEAEDPLADALRQIREALGEVEPEPAPEPAPPTPEPPKPLPERPRPVLPKPVREPEFRGLGAFEHEEHGFGRSNPLSEEVFERQPAFQNRGATDRIEQKPLKQVDLTTPIEVKKVAGPTLRRTTADVLRDPARAREAFIMKEVLDPPRSRRSGR